MRLSHRFGVFVLVLLCPVVSSVGAADEVPFRAFIDTNPVPGPVPGCEPPACIGLDISGTGEATHMGRVSIAGPSRIIPTSPTAGIQTAESTFTAANGDTFTIETTGTFTALQGPLGPVTFSGSWTVVDGTGRFDGATGGGTYSGSAEGPSGTLVVEGRMSRPGPRR
jgi:hypothetical protein